jgi:hypothetical protein
MGKYHRVFMAQHDELPMDQDLKSIDWEQLLPQARIARCRTLASEALERAASADAAMKKHYLELASEWTKLADEMERIALDEEG